MKKNMKMYEDNQKRINKFSENKEHTKEGKSEAQFYLVF